MYYPEGMKARVSPVQRSKPNSILAPTQDERIKLINMQQENMNKEGEMKLNVIEIDREIRMKELDLKVLELKEKSKEVDYNMKMREMKLIITWKWEKWT